MLAIHEDFTLDRYVEMTDGLTRYLMQINQRSRWFFCPDGLHRTMHELLQWLTPEYYRDLIIHFQGQGREPVVDLTDNDVFQFDSDVFQDDYELDPAFDTDWDPIDDGIGNDVQVLIDLTDEDIDEIIHWTSP
jgi:hypothetical protein